MSARELITGHLDLWTGAVTKKSSSGRGSNGKVELRGIEKLRELILELAVRGKLVDQNSNDECASVLLEKISQEKATLAGQGKIKKPKRLPALTREDVPFELPNGWQWARIFEVSELITSGSRDWAKYYSESGAIFITMGNLSRGDYKLRLDNIRYVSPPTGGEGARTSLQGGDLVVSITGDVGNLGLIPEGFGEAYINQHSCLVRISSLCRNRYHAEFLRSPCAKRQFDEPQRGVKNSFRLSDMGEMLIPVPPLEEQHRIVQKVDELMVLCDRLEQQTIDQLEAHKTLVDTLLGTLIQSENATELADNWARLAAHFDTLFTTEQSIDKLKQTILQLAVLGRLVEQDAEDVHAKHLVAAATQASENLILEGKLKKPRKFKISNEDKRFRKLPDGWSRVEVGELFQLQNGYAFKSSWFTECGPRLLRNVNISHGYIDWTDSVYLPETMATEFARFELKKGDIVISLDRPLISTGLKYAIIRDCDVPSLLLQRVARFRQYSDVVRTGYLEYWLNSEMFTSSIDPGRSNGVPHISTGQIEALKFPLPPEEEQRRIAQKVDELMALCDQLKERLSQASETRCQLAEAVVQGALN